MTAYLMMIRNSIHDPEGMKKYAELAPLAPHEKCEIIAAKTCRYEVLEGEKAEAAVILRFPTWDDALAWYRSPEYQAAVKYRLASGSYRTVIVDGVEGVD